MFQQIKLHDVVFFLLAFDEFYVIIPDTEHYFQGLSVAPPPMDDYWHKLIPQAMI